MRLSNLTFIVTDQCNFNCSYCPQKKEKKTINNNTIETAVDFFYPFLKDDDKNYISFYGGEPLLAYEQMKHAVGLVQEKNKKGNKKITFSVTTNGSLLTDEMLDFFNCRQFAILLSFDGLAQEKSRHKGSLGHMVQVIKQIRAYPGIDLEINSVFTPQTIGDFSESLRFIIELEVPAITFNISTMEEWNAADLEILKLELDRLTAFLAANYKKTGKIPVKNFQGGKPAGIFQCNAGKDHMAVTPDGDLWGCFLFHDYFKTRQDSPQYHDYYFGTLTDFIVDYGTIYPGISANYSELRQDLFRVEENFCFLCENVEGCTVCPVNAAYSSGTLGKISCRQCKLIKIQENARGLF